MVRTIKRGYFGVFAVFAAMVLLCVLAGTSGAAERDIFRVSVNSSGAEGNGISGYGWGEGDADISDDGRYVAFTSWASNLVDGDTNASSTNPYGPDVFVRDRTTSTTERVSVSSSGVEANGRSHGPSISADGRYVAFFSAASNLVDGDTNNTNDVFVHDRNTGTTERVSVGVNPDGSKTEANGGSGLPSISADGRYVAFVSAASNLVANDGGAQDVFVYDRNTGTTERVSVGVNPDGSKTEANGGSGGPSISADGRYVAFDSVASNIVANDTNTIEDVFVYDRTTGATQWLSRFGPCLCTAATQGSYNPSISANGRYVAFTGSTTNGVEVFVRDRIGATSPEWVSRPASGATWQNEAGGSIKSSISADGRYVLFSSIYTNLVGGDTNGKWDVFLRDRSTKTTELVSVSSCTTRANGDSYSSDISADGRYVAFSSYATNLVAGDTNGSNDVFVHDRQLKDCIAPTTTANATVPNGTGGTSSYASGTPTTQNVTVNLNAQDNQDGSGIKEMRYSATGADPISEQTVSAANLPATFTIDAAGTTTISYSAADEAGNQESPKTFMVNIDRTPPKVDTVYPANGEKNVMRAGTPFVRFSEKVNSASISTSTFKLFKCSSTTSTTCNMQVTGSTNTDGLSAGFNPFGGYLDVKSKYKAIITTGVTDEAGNALDQDPSAAGNQEKVWYFTTGR